MDLSHQDPYKNLPACEACELNQTALPCKASDGNRTHNSLAYKASALPLSDTSKYENNKIWIRI